MTGAFAFPALAAGAVSAETGQAYHDTYYVVAHGPYLAATALAAITVFGAWAMILWLRPRYHTWVARGLVILFLAGLALAILPTLYVQLRISTLPDNDLMTFAESLHWVNRLTLAGSLAAALGILGTAIAFLWTVTMHLRGRA